MSRATKRRGGRLGLGLALAGLLLGCNETNKPDSKVPGPSEANEELLVGATEAPPADQAQTVDPEEAAKQAAAQKVLEQVKDRDPEEEKKKLARSHAISAQAGDKLARGQLQEAVNVARQALKVHEQNVDAMLVLANVYYKQGKYELVRAVTSSALQVDAKIRTPEETSRAYNLQGFAMLAMGEESPATQSFKKAAEVDEKNAAAWNNLGTRYLDAGDTGTALACFKYALELDPRFFKAHLNYGAALRASHKWEEAEAELRKALELRPGYAEAYFNLGVLYLDADPFPNLDTTQRLNKAIQNLNKYRELAGADGAARPGPGTTGAVGSGAGAPPARVSKARADDFIRVAKKGLEREERRLDREKEREAAPTPVSPAAGGEAAGGEAAGGEPAGASDEPAAESPTPQGPGAEEPAADEPSPQGPTPQGPTKPTPQGPAKPTPQGPAKPTPQGPTPQGPAKPAPQGPTTQGPAKPAPQGPSQPAPKQPAPQQPKPQGPTTQGPSQPAPKQPAPQQPKPQGPAQPAPQQPAPQQPTPAPPPPQSPSPQKPSVQKPQVSRLHLPHPFVEKVPTNPRSRGTRSAGSTLSPMEAGAVASSCVRLPRRPNPRGASTHMREASPLRMVIGRSSMHGKTPASSLPSPDSRPA